MTDPTRPPSPGETPAEGTSTEIPAGTPEEAPLGDEPGVADNLAPDGGETPFDVASAAPPFGSAAEPFVGEDPATADEWPGDRAGVAGRDALSPVDRDVLLEPDVPSMTGEEAGDDQPRHEGH